MNRGRLILLVFTAASFLLWFQNADFGHDSEKESGARANDKTVETENGGAATQHQSYPRILTLAAITNATIRELATQCLSQFSLPLSIDQFTVVEMKYSSSGIAVNTALVCPRKVPASSLCAKLSQQSGGRAGPSVSDFDFDQFEAVLRDLKEKQTSPLTLYIGNDSKGFALRLAQLGYSLIVLAQDDSAMQLLALSRCLNGVDEGRMRLVKYSPATEKFPFRQTNLIPHMTDAQVARATLVRTELQERDSEDLTGFYNGISSVLTFLSRPQMFQSKITWNNVAPGFDEVIKLWVKSGYEVHAGSGASLTRIRNYEELVLFRHKAVSKANTRLELESNIYFANPRFAKTVQLQRCLNPNLPTIAGIVTPVENPAGAWMSCSVQPDAVCRTIRLEGSWDEEEFARMDGFVKEYKRRGKTPFVVDFGANVGAYSVRLAFSGTDVFSMEAMPANAQLLHTSKCLNGMGENYRIVHQALGDVEKQCWVVAHETNKHDGMISCGDEAHRKAEAARGYTGHKPLQIKKFDTVMAETEIGEMVNDDNRVLIVKIDVEGFELFIWRGATKLLTHRNRPRIILTEMWQGLSGEEYWDIMAPHGYQLWGIGQKRWITSREDMTAYKETNGFANRNLDDYYFVQPDAMDIFHLIYPETKK